ncbi:MAG: hypothetical protein H6716_20320 [Polyangiaceae bacterium]|nr:hypothetical protein [Polyangiaceae bacterium]
MPTLKKLFDTAGGRYEEVRDAAEASIVRREWADSPRYWLEPYYGESNCFGRGKLVEMPVVDARGLVEHGFDAEGRLVVVRTYNELPKRQWLPGRGEERPASEVYFVYHADEVDALCFDSDAGKSVVNVARYRYQGHQLVEVQTRYRIGAERVEYFEWAGELPVRARASQPGYERLLEFTHDASGELELVEWVYPNGSRAEMFRRIHEAPEVVLERVKGALQVAARDLLGACDVGTPIAAIAMWLDMEAFEHLLPPRVGLLTLEEQTAFASEPAKREYVWSPVEWEHYDTQELEFEDEALHRAASDANQLIWQQGLYQQARDLVDVVCRELNAEGLGSLLQSTPECIIFPVDITSGDGEQGVRRVVTEAQLTALKRKGLLQD